MKTKKNAHSRLFAMVIVIMMVITLTSTSLVLNAGAIAPGRYVASHGTQHNSGLPGTLAEGQIWTGKNVEDDGAHFGIPNNGQFGITLSAVAGGPEEVIDDENYSRMSLVEGDGDEQSYLITEAGITFTDTYNSNFDFVYASPTEIRIFLNDTDTFADLQSNGTYTFSNSNGSVVFNPMAMTIVYTIPMRALKLLPADTTNVELSNLNYLEYGVILKDSETLLTEYDTNPLGSCVASFNASDNNPYYYGWSHHSVYTNTGEWQDLELPALIYFPDETITSLSWIRFYFDADGDGHYNYMGSDYYAFSGAQIGLNPATAAGPYSVWVNGGEYLMSNGDLIKISSSDSANKYSFSVDYGTLENTGKNTPLSGSVISKWVPGATPQFTVSPIPTVPGTVTVMVGTTEYTGDTTGFFTDATHWSFMTSDGTVVTLDGLTLTVDSEEGYWIEGRSVESRVRQTHNAYGYLNLATPSIQNDPQTGSLAVSKVVAEGDSTSEEFAFTVTFARGTSTVADYLAGIVAPSGATVNGGVYSLSLSAADGVVSFSKIPVGVTYTVTETISGPQGLDGWSADTDNTRNTTGTIGTAGASAIVANEQAEVQGTSDIETPSPEPSLNAGTSSEPSSNVAGDSDILPQTDGISTSTLLGIFGLMIIAIGGTAYTIFRKKFLS